MSKMSLVTSAPTKAKWNAAAYAANSVVQHSWARELISKLHLGGNEHVLDVGCGDGKVTAEIARALPKGLVTGTDASAEMIAFAREMFPSEICPNLRFAMCDARKIAMKAPILERRAPARRDAVEAVNLAGTVPGAPFDVVFSNAALHWVDDHEAFLKGVSSVMKPGGRLIVSCGGRGNAQDVFHALRPEMRLKRWRGFFRQMPTPYFFYSPGDYEKWLPKFGFKINTVKLAPKDAVYPGADGFATWLRTTWIPYVQRVPEEAREEFISAVTERYVAKHPPDKSDQVHVRMVRLEIDAQKL